MKHMFEYFNSPALLLPGFLDKVTMEAELYKNKHRKWLMSTAADTSVPAIAKKSPVADLQNRRP